MPRAFLSLLPFCYLVDQFEVWVAASLFNAWYNAPSSIPIFVGETLAAVLVALLFRSIQSRPVASLLFRGGSNDSSLVLRVSVAIASGFFVTLGYEDVIDQTGSALMSEKFYVGRFRSVFLIAAVTALLYCVDWVSMSIASLCLTPIACSPTGEVRKRHSHTSATLDGLVYSYLVLTEVATVLVDIFIHQSAKLTLILLGLCGGCAALTVVSDVFAAYRFMQGLPPLVPQRLVVGPDGAAAPELRKDA